MASSLAGLIREVRPGPSQQEDDGKFVAIEVGTGDYEMDEDDDAAVARSGGPVSVRVCRDLHSRRPTRPAEDLSRSIRVDLRTGKGVGMKGRVGREGVSGPKVWP